MNQPMKEGLLLAAALGLAVVAAQGMASGYKPQSAMAEVEPATAVGNYSATTPETRPDTGVPVSLLP